MSLVLFSLQFVLNIALPWWIVRLSEGRLSPQAASRAWNDASFRSAVVVFGPLCLPVHFARVGAGPLGWHWLVRLSLGLGLGVAVMFLEAIVVALASSAVALLWPNAEA